MTADATDRILADFRTWLEALPDSGAARPETLPPPAVDLGALAAQFTALRHDVNLQTKATRAVLDQSGEALKQLAARPTFTDAESHLKPTRKLLIDLADALSLSHAQISKSVAANAESAEINWPAPPEGPKNGFWNRLLGGPNIEYLRWADTMQAHAGVILTERDHLREILAGLADGYTLSLRRVERALPHYSLEPIECDGYPFDPELMEVVEVIGDSDRPSGTVVHVVRAGYRVGGQVIRFAQVAVAR